MKDKPCFTAKQVGQRIKERRLELKLSMGELGERLGVNKSTIQRYEVNGIEPDKIMKISPVAEALLTTPEWLTGLSESKEYDTYTLCERDIQQHIKAYLETISATVDTEPHQQMLNGFLGQMIDMYAIICQHFGRAMVEADRIAADEGLKESLKRYAIESGDITEKAYRNEMTDPLNDMKRMVDCLLRLYDVAGRNSISEFYQITMEAQARLDERNNSVAP